MMDNNFQKASVPVNTRSMHDMGNHHITTIDFGWLAPIYWLECVPGDVVKYHPTIFMRTPALATTTFGNIKISQHSFFVPSRLLWDDFENFILGGDDGRRVYTKPYCVFGDLAALLCTDVPAVSGSVRNSDNFIDLLCTSSGATGTPHNDITRYERGLWSTTIYSLGLNPTSGLDLQRLAPPFTYDAINSSVYNEHIDLMPFRAYTKIWWDYYRDSVLIPESAKATYIKTSGGRQFTCNLGDPSSIGHELGTIQIQGRKKCYRKDYFTTAKVSPQQGSVSIVPVDLGKDVNPGLVGPVSGSYKSLSVTGPASASGAGNVFIDSPTANHPEIGQFSVEVLRVANSYQRWLEKNNAAGSRPIAQILARFGFTPSAERLDMAEYVDGEDRILDIQQVTSTAQTTEGDLAENAAYGITRYSTGEQAYAVREHGIFMSLLAVEPMTGYCDGIDKSFQRFDKEDLYTPEYENLGYEAIANKELYTRLFEVTGDTPQSPDLSFGFQPRYSSYKFKKDVLAGDFVRLNTQNSSSPWHTFRRFDDIPQLNSMFPEIHVNSTGNNWHRLFVNTRDDYDPFFCDILNENKMERPMNGFATPALANVNEQDGRHISIPYGGVRL